VCIVLYCVVVPDTPHIDVAKCSRSTSSVVLVLDVPGPDNDVIDGYRVFYSTDQDRPIDVWVRLIYISHRIIIRIYRHARHVSTLFT